MVLRDVLKIFPRKICQVKQRTKSLKLLTFLGTCVFRTIFWHQVVLVGKNSKKLRLQKTTRRSLPRQKETFRQRLIAQQWFHTPPQSFSHLQKAQRGHDQFSSVFSLEPFHDLHFEPANMKRDSHNVAITAQDEHPGAFRIQSNKFDPPAPAQRFATLGTSEIDRFTELKRARTREVRPPYG